MLLNPATETFDHLDENSAALMRQTIDFFEERGKAALKQADHERTFRRQVRTFKGLLFSAKPKKQQAKDFDFLLILGELFTLVAYGQLILENARLQTVDDDVIDQIFDTMVRDFSKFALQLYCKPAATRGQRLLAKQMIRRPSADDTRRERVWQRVLALDGAYTMNP